MRRVLPGRRFATRVPILVLAALLRIAEAQQGSYPKPDLRVDVSLAMIPVTVTDSRGTPVPGLSREHFRLFVDGVEQKIVFVAGEDVPVSVCLVFDLSSSMKDKMATASHGAISLLRSFDHPDDEFALVVFGERPTVAVPFTRDVGEIEEKLNGARTLGRTSLFDAIHVAMAQLRTAHTRRRVMVIVSDGGDNHSRLTKAGVQRDLRESDVQIQAMSLHHHDGSLRSMLALEEQNGALLLAAMAAETGGRHVDLMRLKDLSATCARIARELHNQYVLGYVPQAQDGSLHRVKIVVAAPDSRPWTVQYRREIFTPKP
ncbi:MAG: VWA domain-containing protein [Bryobacteraceae bacterium]